MQGDEIWDEERWEAFLRENDRRVDRFMAQLFRFLTDNPAPPTGDPAARVAWEARLRDFLRAHGLELDDDLLRRFGQDDDEAPAEGSWFLGLDLGDDDPEAIDDVLDTYEHLPVYRRAFALVTDVLEWTNALPGAVKTSTLVHFCSHLTQVPANIAKGHTLGYERETIGGNIACVKRGLTSANAALRLLPELKRDAYLDDPDYRRLYERTFELRNELGIYVQDLRTRFDLGIE